MTRTLTDLELRSIRLQRIFQIYMWPMPFQWNADYSRLETTKPYCKQIPFYGIMLFLCFYDALIFFAIFQCILPNPSLDLFSVRLLILLASGSALFAFIIIVMTETFNNHCLAHFVNDLVWTSNRILTEFPPTRAEGNRGPVKTLSAFMGNFLAFVVAPTCAMIPLLGTMGSLMSGIDGGYYVLEAVLPDPKTRELKTTVAALLVRGVAVLFLLQQFCCVAMNWLSLVFIFCNRTKLLMHVMIVRVRDGSSFYRIYTLCRLIYCKAIRWISLLNLLTLSGLFWGFVVTFWVCVKRSPSVISMSIYSIFFALFIIMLIANKIFVPVYYEIIELFKYAVQVNRIRAEIIYAKRRTFENRHVLKQVRSVHRIKSMYGNYWELGQELTPEYLSLIVERCIDAVLIFE